MIFGRFLMRLLLVPLGAGVAIVVAVFVVIFAHWNRFSELLATDPSNADSLLIALIVAGPAPFLLLSFTAVAMLLPALLGVLISEAFAIRSWMFHAANGGLSAFVGWGALADFREHYKFYDEPLIVVGAGIAAGFAYWVIAGWSAGFWKPVFASAKAATPPQPSAPA
jgi:hypothetical protein